MSPKTGREMTSDEITAETGAFTQVYFMPIIPNTWVGPGYEEYKQAEERLKKELLVMPHATKGYIRKVYQTYQQRR